VIVVFVCENGSRTGRMPTSGKRFRPETSDFGWPFPVQEVVVPCAGRLQPEHLLKAFEGGADAVAVVCCERATATITKGTSVAVGELRWFPQCWKKWVSARDD